MAEGESSAIALLLLEETTGLSRMQLMMADRIDCDEAALLRQAKRIAGGEPVQYVLGTADFCGLTFGVQPGVLIPRPETEELVQWTVETAQQMPADRPLRVLDIGTGSGCIAVSLAHLLPEAEVTALDVSDDALRIASANARRNGVQVHFQHLDILTEPLQGTYDIIVSNPPYICNSEAADMERNVLDHEPHLALFVPDADPLLFYRTIAQKALTHLRPSGALLFEINRAYGDATLCLLRTLGYANAELRQDQFGNDRMTKCKAPH